MIQNAAALGVDRPDGIVLSWQRSEFASEIGDLDVTESWRTPAKVLVVVTSCLRPRGRRSGRADVPHLLCILPRSRHRPVASTEGSLTRKVNKTGVRLWA